VWQVRNDALVGCLGTTLFEQKPRQLVQVISAKRG